MRNSLFSAALACLAALCSTQALARVEVQPVQHTSLGRILAVKVAEDIAPGDYEALLKGLRANPGKFARKIVVLDNIGGSVAEAIRMGRLLRETGFDALVPSDAVCQGSCIYLLAAGRDKSVRGYVGLHRPYFPAGDSALAASSPGGYSPSAYLRDMNIPPSLFSDMNSIAPQQMRVLSPQELARYRLD
ncbi:hypothetical protein A9179_19110 [Pseudomonas alcaligenes]|uniref:Periplasmic protein-like protein n=1 Tax=Aquipseudomonas alcaligenes TaxID=43263 RepID=A0ABR7S483_AQUAC|nr:hypothetical protein [Pseudomonas alcaligenes]MBC9252387.1 hypothetical protein [Pseudomonas alcaligenes]